MLALGWQLLVAFVLPPFAYDGLTYHLTNVASWIHAGRIVPSPLSLCCAYYPGNAELPSAWLMILHGQDWLVGIVQIGVAALGGLAVGGLGRTAGLSRRGAAAAGALFVLTPALLAQYDALRRRAASHSVALRPSRIGSLLAATARTSRSIRPWHSVPDILTGTKGNGLAGGRRARTVRRDLAAVRRRRRERLTIGGALPAMAGVVGACLPLGGWWYIRNAVDKGNPMYPFELKVGTHGFFWPTAHERSLDDSPW